MRKFVKVCLIIVACLMFLGIFFAGIGFAIGGSNITTEFARGMNKSIFNRDYIKIGYNVNTDIDYNSSNTDFGDWADSSFEVYNGSLKQTEIAPKEDINEVICNVAACEFVIKESPNDMYSIESTTVGEFRCYQKKDVLYFEGINERKFSSNILGKITLYIPKDVTLEVFEIHAAACELDVNKIQAEQVKIEIGAGDIYINEIIAEDITCDLGAGELVIDFIDAETYTAQIGAGEIYVKKIIADEVETNVGVGNAEFGGIEANVISVICAMGNMEVMVDGSEDEYSYIAKCVAGNVSIGKNGGVILGSSSNEASGNKKITADCAMGNIKIRFSE